MKYEIQDEIFKMQSVYLDKLDKNIISNSTVAIAGIGGVGGYALEALVRNGFSNIRIADHDVFEISNYRQLYMTLDNIGLDKVEVARKRIKEINPNCTLKVYGEGINAKNAREFVEGSSVILQETDTLAASIILNYWGSKLKIPVIHGSRFYWLNSGDLSVKVYDYRMEDYTYNVPFDIYAEKWGVSIDLLKELYKCIETEQDSRAIEKELQIQNDRYRKRKILEFIKENDNEAIRIFSIGKNQEHLLDVMKKYPNEFDKMRIAPEQTMIMGGLVNLAVKNILLKGKVSSMVVKAGE